MQKSRFFHRIYQYTYSKATRLHAQKRDALGATYLNLINHLQKIVMEATALSAILGYRHRDVYNEH